MNDVVEAADCRRNTRRRRRHLATCGLPDPAIWHSEIPNRTAGYRHCDIVTGASMLLFSLGALLVFHIR